MGRLAAAAVLLALLVPAAPGEAGARKLHLMQPVAFSADGSRYAVFEEEWGLRIVDTVARKFSAFGFQQLSDHPSPCRLGDAHAGFAVVNCPHTDWPWMRPWIVDLATLEAETPRGWPARAPVGKYSQAYEWHHVGTHWLGTVDNDTGDWRFWNWRAGEIDLRVWRQSRRLPADLDTPALLALPPRLMAKNARGAVYKRGRRLVLRMGSARVRLARCPCGIDVALSGGRVAWTSGKFLHSYRIRGGRRSRWRVPGPKVGYGTRRILHTQNRLFVRDWDSRGTYRVSGTRWPLG